jgi:hypothetical protein
MRGMEEKPLITGFQPKQDGFMLKHLILIQCIFFEKNE